MRYCGNCGTALEDGSFCPNCGAPVEPEMAGYNSGYEGAVNEAYPEKNSKAKYIIIIAAVVVLAAALVCIILLTRQSSEKVVDSCLDAILDEDAEGLIALFPDSLVNYMADTEYNGDVDDMIDDLDDNLGEIFDEMGEIGVDASDITFEIVSERDLDEDELNDIETSMDLRRAGVEVKKAKETRVKITTTTFLGDETESIYIQTGKVGHSWYLIGLE